MTIQKDKAIPDDPILRDIEAYQSRKHRPLRIRPNKKTGEKTFYIVIDGHTHTVLENKIPLGYKGIRKEIKNPS